MIVLGIDPDTKNTGVAIVRSVPGNTPRVIAVRTIAVPPRKPVQARLQYMAAALQVQLMRLSWIDQLHDHALDRIIVEGQQVYRGSKADPNDLLRLAQVTGMAQVAADDAFGIAADVVLPRDWSTVPKPVRAKRIVSKVAFDCGREYDDLTKTQRGHVIDAIGLALWGIEHGSTL